MSEPRPTLILLFLRAMLVPMAGFAVWSVVERVAGSQRWVLLAGIAGFFLVIVVGTVMVQVVRVVYRRWRRREGEMEFGVRPPVCAHCGYDLRASPDHCPECGRPVDPLDRTIIRYLTKLRTHPADRPQRRG